MIFFKWLYTPSGQCPVQADGIFLGYHFYFRSRHELSTIDFYRTKEDWENLHPSVLYLELKTDYNKYMAGYISKRKARRLIYKGCLLFLIYRLSIKKHQD